MADYPPTPSFGVPYNLQHSQMSRSARPIQSTFPSQAAHPIDTSVFDSNTAYGYNSRIPGVNNVALQPSQSFVPDWPIAPPSNVRPLTDYSDLSQTNSPFPKSRHEPTRYASPQGLQMPPGLKELSANSGKISVGDTLARQGAYEGVTSTKVIKPLPPHPRDEYARDHSHGYNAPLEDQNATGAHLTSSVNGAQKELEENSRYAHSSRRSTQAAREPHSSAYIRRDSLYDSLESGDDTGFAEYYRSEEHANTQTTAPQDSISPEPTLRSQDLKKAPFESKTSGSTPKTLAEARKEAKNVILNLLPAKVRFQTYIEEGFDESFIRGLFEDLKIPLPSTTPQSVEESDLSRRPKPAGVITGHSTVNELGSSSHPASQVGPDSTDKTTASSTSQKTTLDSSKKDGEERKDRIARLLAEKKQKQLSTTSPIHSSPKSKATQANISHMAGTRKSAKGRQEEINHSHITAIVSNPSAISHNPTPSDADAIREEKRRLLQAKIAELQRTRSDRAQAISASGDSGSDTTSQAPIMVKPNIPTSIPYAQITAQRSPPIVEESNSPPSSIPGLFLTTTGQAPASLSAPVSPGPSNQRKRPVAADFDEPTPATLPHKRPFGQTRAEHSLVIDVSESEDDDGNDEVSNIRHNSIPTMRELASTPLADLTNKPRSNSSYNTPPNSRPEVGPEALQQREMAIQEMKRKIAELERKKQLAKASGRQTPSGSNQAIVAEVASAASGKNSEISMEVEQLVRDAANEAGLANIDAGEAILAELEQTMMDPSQQHLNEIDVSIRSIDAAVEENRRHLIGMKLGIERLEGKIRKSLQEKQKLVEKAEEIRRAAKQASESLEVEQDGSEAISESTTVVHRQTVTGSPKEAEAPPKVAPFEGSEQNMSNATSRQDSPGSNSISSSSSGSPAPAIANESLSDEHTPTADSSITSSKSNLQHRDSYIGSDLSADSPEQPSADTNNDVEVEQDISMNDVNSPEVTSQVDSGLENPEEESTEDSGNDIEMAGSDTYEPPDAEDYEPPDVEEADDDESSSASSRSDSPPFSPAPPDVLEVQDTSAQGHSASASPVNQVVLGRVSGLTDLVEQHKPAVVDNHSPGFTKYQTPLKYFRAYRFHPDYLKEVEGGFKSLTYSHKIDLFKEVCRYELAGGRCNDQQCEFQHFEDMALNENTILVELGSSAPYNEADRANFVAGLKEVLHQVKVNNIKDFRSIAAEIAAYRPRFLADPTRVVSVDRNITL